MAAIGTVTAAIVTGWMIQSAVLAATINGKILNSRLVVTIDWMILSVRLAEQQVAKLTAVNQ
jgi:hypothetical protein